MGDFVIPLQDLDSLGKDFSFALEQAWLDQYLEGTGVAGDTSRGAGEVRVHAQRNGREILVQGHAKASLLSECVRCLKGLPIDVEAELTTLFAPGELPPTRANQLAQRADPQEPDDDIVFDPSEPDRAVYQGDALELDIVVRDALLLELPMQTRCDKGWACPNLDLPEHLRAPDGVSTKGFDADRIDPRLAPLIKLAKDGEHDKE